MEQCKQEGPIGEIRATLRFFQEAEKRRETREERAAAAMEKIAAQGETIRAHAETLTRHERNFDNIFARLRIVEIDQPDEDVSAGAAPSGPPRLYPEALETPDKSTVVRIFSSPAGPYIAAVLVAGFLVALTTNYEALAKLITLICTIG